VTTAPAALNDMLLMLVIMNPFAQTLYLSELMNRTSVREFSAILLQGVLMTFIICLTCAFLGRFLLFQVFQVTLPAMRVFGGLINLQLSYSYVMKGPAGVKLFSGDITEIAQQIAMPIMVGAGVVWISMRIGETHAPAATVTIIGAALAINTTMILTYRLLFSMVHGKPEKLLVKYFGVAMRFNALLIGALSVQMILGGTTEFLAEQK
jgi:small neutral amino acid transporter SnatA (MarC family)